MTVTVVPDGVRALLADGGVVRIRVRGPSDVGDVLALHQHVALGAYRSGVLVGVAHYETSRCVGTACARRAQLRRGGQHRLGGAAGRDVHPRSGAGRSGRRGHAVRGVGIAVLESLGQLGLGVSTMVSTGDKYDVSGNDMLLWWQQDPCTDVAVLYLESFGNPRKFSRLARILARTRPVLAARSAESDVAQQAAASHTAAAATPAVTRDALFRQAGVIAVDSVTELIADRAARLTPLSDVDAEQLVHDLRSSAALFGPDGREPLPVENIVDLITRVGHLADTLPEVAELDLNPVVVRHDGCLVLDARVRLVSREPANPYLRRLRS